MKTYKYKVVKGSTRNTEWWTQEDWDNHAKLVRELMESGEFGKLEEIEITMVGFPHFDNISRGLPAPIFPSQVLSYEFVDFNNTPKNDSNTPTINDNT